MGDPSANNSQEGDFKKVETLGSGCFGSVDLCTVEEGKTYAERGDRVAVKRFFSIAEAEMAKKEVKILNRLKKHRYIVAYLDHFRDSKGQLAIVMEYCDQGTLGGFLSSRTTLLRPIPEFEIWRLVWQFSTALEFLLLTAAGSLLREVVEKNKRVNIDVCKTLMPPFPNI